MSNTVTVVTSFSEEGWEKYAKDMVESVAEHWEDSIKLIAYYHDFNLEEKSPPIKSNIEYRDSYIQNQARALVTAKKHGEFVDENITQDEDRNN